MVGAEIKLSASWKQGKWNNYQLLAFKLKYPKQYSKIFKLMLYGVF